MKTEQQIERDFFVMIKNSELGQAVRGGVYRAELRPYNSKNEDLIVKLLSGLDGQVQTGVVVLNLYVPDINSGGRSVIDYSRISDLQLLINDFILRGGNEYRIEAESTAKTMLNDEIGQHFISVRIKYYVLD